MKKNLSLKEMIEKDRVRREKNKNKPKKVKKPKQKPLPLTDEQKKKIDVFYKMLTKYADIHKLKISETNWAKSKIEWMALNNNKCGCRPETRRCPCKESLEETKNGKFCTCSVLKGV